MEEKLARRQQVPLQLTWDLSLIYPSEADYQADLEKMIALSKEIVENYPNTLSTPKRIHDCVESYRQVMEIMVLTSNYAQLAVEVDYYDTQAQKRAGALESIIHQIQADLAFIATEIAFQDEIVLNQALALSTNGKGYLQEIIRNKPHMLSNEVEKTLSALQTAFDTPLSVYNHMKLADMQFDNFEVENQTYPLGYSLFEDDYEYRPDTAIRRAAFYAFSKKIKQYENATATAYNAYCQNEKVLSQLRGFKTIFEKDLFYDHVTVDLYHRQIDLIMQKLSAPMQKYARLIKKVHHLDQMTYADLKLPIDPDYCPTITIEQSKEYIKNGLAILGADYLSMIQQAYDQRWIDFAKNQGKCTGGFCSSPYNRNSFILMSWNNNMADVFTLAHELGHCGHFKLCNQAQAIFDTNVSNYFVEAPSTINEMLLSHYLLSTNSDKRFQRWVLSNMVGKTYYHNFVTHLLEAAYQREVYRLIDQGQSVNAEVLSSLFKQQLQAFWGDAVELVEGSELTWMRQPHYYMGLYSYSYSAGLTIATQVCKRIEKEKEVAVADWKKALEAGSSLDPIALAKLAGVDITTDQPLLDTIQTISDYIDEICRLTDELEQEQC